MLSGLQPVWTRLQAPAARPNRKQIWRAPSKGAAHTSRSITCTAVYSRHSGVGCHLPPRPRAVNPAADAYCTARGPTRAAKCAASARETLFLPSVRTAGRHRHAPRSDHARETALRTPASALRVPSARCPTTMQPFGNNSPGTPPSCGHNRPLYEGAQPQLLQTLTSHPCAVRPCHSRPGRGEQTMSVKGLDICIVECTMGMSGSVKQL